MAARAQAPATAGATASVVAGCGCGATYTAAQWQSLTTRRLWVFDEETLEIAECTAPHEDRDTCSSTIAVPVPPKSSPGVRVETCFSCFGDGGDYDYEAQTWCACKGCGGHGEIIVCLGLGGPDTDCGGTVLIDDAREHGAFCATCRAALDQPAT